jgi:hypothetical protein
MAAQAAQKTAREAKAYHPALDSRALDGLLASTRDEMLLGIQRRALLLLWEMRRRSAQVSAGFDAWAEEADVDLTLLYDRVELGERVGFTVEEDVHFGTHAMGRRLTTRMRDGCAVPVTAMKYPPMVPAGETEAECDRRRRRCSRARRKADMEQREAADRAAVVITGTLAERRLASLLAVLPTSPAKAITLAEAVKRVAKTETWAGLAPRSVAQFVKVMVSANTGVLIAARPAVEGHTKLQIWRFTSVNNAKVEAPPSEAHVPQPLPSFADFPKPRQSLCLSHLLKGRDDATPPQGALRTDGVPDAGPPAREGMRRLGRQRGPAPTSLATVIGQLPRVAAEVDAAAAVIAEDAA